MFLIVLKKIIPRAHIQYTNVTKVTVTRKLKKKLN